MNLPPTSLIICSRNRPKLLNDAVETVLRGEETPTEIVVIDQSDAPYPDLANLKGMDGCEVRYIWSRKVGASQARNEGVARARHDILAFTDDDILVSPAWFGTLIGSLLEGGANTVVSGSVLPTAEQEHGGFAPSIMISDTPAFYEGRIGKDVLWTGNLAMYRSAFERAGGFDERLGPGAIFPAAEDNDMGFRLLEARYRVLYEPRAIVYHRIWRSERDYLPLRWSYGCGQGAFYAKYISLKDSYFFRRITGDLVDRLSRLPGLMLHQPRQAFGSIVYLAGLLYGAIRWMLTQRRARA